MACKNCKSHPVIKLTNTNISLCKNCFIHYFEKKVFKNVRKYDLLDDCKTIGVAVSGGKNSLIVLCLLNKLVKQRISKNVKIIAIHIDEGIKNYSEIASKTLKQFCKINQIELKEYSIKNKKASPEIWVRYLLNKKARELKIERLATGHNLDAEAETIIMNQSRKDIERSARLGPITGFQTEKKFIPRIKPLYFILEQESEIYAKIKEFRELKNPYLADSYRENIKKFLNEVESKYPGTKYNIINSFLEILPLLKNKFKTKIVSCESCGEPCSNKICSACKSLS
ncbi:MAG: TIGR00269 family protein [Candidatus Nanoarchaeia archaeon]|nr:TIGR00269 family protein [Candidatus Nanoarchaeia archaeon]MDD5588414.1 TIGR00269 family protein [Candidatus Nanoarchaeia archaeon]